MTIKLSTFSGWKLSGEDAVALLNQLDALPNPVAQATIKNGFKFFDAASNHNDDYPLMCYDLYHKGQLQNFQYSNVLNTEECMV